MSPSNRQIKRIHRISGTTLSIFIGLHLFNHLYGIFGSTKHIELMNLLRHFYRNIFVEIILIMAVCIQIVSGLRLFKAKKKIVTTMFEKLQIWTGLYLVIFLVIHLTAVLGGRYYLHLDTNFYFGAAGLNSFPFNLFFIPYYGLAIISVFGHIASVHNNKMKQNVFWLTPNGQSKTILAFGFYSALIIIYAMTNHFRGVVIPKEYNILIGK